MEREAGIAPAHFHQTRPRNRVWRLSRLFARTKRASKMEAPMDDVPCATDRRGIGLGKILLSFRRYVKTISLTPTIWSVLFVRFRVPFYRPRIR